VKLKAMYLQLLKKFFPQDRLRSIQHGFRAIFKDYLLYIRYVGALKMKEIS